MGPKLRTAIPLIIVFIVFSTNTGLVLADDAYWGIWRASKGADPKIEVSIKRKKRTQVSIYGKDIPMKYQWTSGEQGHGLMEFINEEIQPDGSETHIGLYFIGGTLKGKAVLAGFYYHIKYDAEGRATSDIQKPITLYLVKSYGWKD